MLHLTPLFRFMANLLVTIFMTLNLNPVMNIMFNVPAGCADTVRPRLISSVVVIQSSSFWSFVPEYPHQLFQAESFELVEVQLSRHYADGVVKSLSKIEIVKAGCASAI